MKSFNHYYDLADQIIKTSSIYGEYIIPEFEVLGILNSLDKEDLVFIYSLALFGKHFDNPIHKAFNDCLTECSNNDFSKTSLTTSILCNFPQLPFFIAISIAHIKTNGIY
jgi:hypothetical protein